VITVDNITGEVTIDFTYNTSLNSHKNLDLNYTLNGKTRIITLPSNTDNNLAFKLYDSQTYYMQEILQVIVQVVSYVAMGVFILGMLVSRLIAIEMIFIFQFTHCGLVTLRKL